MSVVLNGYNSQFRYEADDVLNHYLLGEIATVARDYGARDAVPPPIMEECIRLVKQKFTFLGQGEIREAYRQWSVGELNVKGAEMYEGKFNVAQLGKILGAYCRQRKGVLGGYLNLIHDADFAARKQAQEAKRAEQFEKEFPRRIAAARMANMNWQAVPEFWYKAALKRGMIDISKEEGLRIYELAKRVLQMQRRANPEQPISDKLKERLGLVPAADFETEAKRIARKITVYRKLIKA